MAQPSEQSNNSMSEEEIMERMREHVRRHRGTRTQTEMIFPPAFPSSIYAETPDAYDLSGLYRNVANCTVQWKQVGTLNPRPPGLHNTLIQLFKKGLLRMLSWYTRPLHAFHASVTRSLNETTCAIEQLQSSAMRTGQRLEEMEASQEHLTERLERLEKLCRDQAGK
jgi:hypothetical protein